MDWEKPKKSMRISKTTVVVLLLVFVFGTAWRSVQASAYIWTDQTLSGSLSWNAIASSSDGTKLAAVVSGGDIYTSADSGVHWTDQTIPGSAAWTSIASSSDGTELIAGQSSGDLWTYSAGTWTDQVALGSKSWIAVASSSDGMELAAAVSGGSIYISFDSGTTWNDQSLLVGSRSWTAITESSDGTRFLATESGGDIWRLLCGGGTCSSASGGPGPYSWSAIASSSNGTEAVAVVGGTGDIYISNDSGASWTDVVAPGSGIVSANWRSVAMSSDGTKIVAPVDGADIFTSVNGGTNWTDQIAAGSQDWRAVASSSDNGKLAVAVDGGDIWTSFFDQSPNLPSALAPTNKVDGSAGNNNQPTLAFSLSDPDVSDTVKYEIVISAQSDFSSPVVDYTSALAAQGSASFAVGQAAGGGSYAIGSSGQTLSDAPYYWEVKSTDNSGLSSSYAVANSGSVAFSIDTVAPVISEVTPVSTPTTNHTPSYTFTTNEAGTISYGGGCASSTTAATSGSNTITFNTLPDSTYGSCTIVVTDAAGNASNTLAVTSFTITTPSHGGGGGGGGTILPPPPPSRCDDPVAVNYLGAPPCEYGAALCEDAAATNYNDALPCTYPVLCEDTAASNYKEPLPCAYPLLCRDRNAANYGQAGTCSYPPALCEDATAANYKSSLPCRYQMLCQDRNAANYGAPLPCVPALICTGSGCSQQACSGPDCGLASTTSNQNETAAGGDSSISASSGAVPVPQSSDCVPAVPATNSSGVILQTAEQSYCQTVFSISIASAKVKKIFASPKVDIAAKTITTVGVVAGAAITITSALFLNPISFSEIFLIPIRLWSLLMTALGLKKRRRPWGTVYDSVTKQPLDPAYVVLRSSEGVEIGSTLTDLDGRYGFIIPEPGSYALFVKKTNYVFPSQHLVGHDHDELYRDLYFGEYFTAATAGEVVVRNVPMDPEKFDWNEFAKKEQHLMKFYSNRNKILFRIADIFFGVGFVVSAVAVLAAPKGYNIAVFVLYSVVYFVRKYGLKARPFGYVADKNTGKPMPFAIIRISYASSGVELMHRITDGTGKYYCLLPNGEYRVRIDRKLPDGTYEMAAQDIPATVTKGYLAKTFEA